MVEIYKKATSSFVRPLQNARDTHAKRRHRLNALLVNEFSSKASDVVTNPFASFCYYPTGVSFVNKDDKEDIILFLRKHPFTNIRWMLISFFLIVLPGFISVLPFIESMPISYQVFLFIIWYLIVGVFMLEQFLKWFYHVNILTDERIVEVDFLNLIYREITDANIDQIQDVTVKIGGGFRTILNYGDVQVQTAAGIPEICFEAVPRPDVVAKILRDMRVEEEQEKLEGRVR